jgi:glycosyltransferase 2 family protein
MKNSKIIPILFGIIVVAGFIYKIGISELINSIIQVNRIYLLISSVILFITMLVKSLRWYYILKPLGAVNLKIAFVSYFIGQATNEILPTGSGELTRLTILKKFTNKSFTWFSPSVILERLYDMFLLLILSIFFAYTTESNLAFLTILPIIAFVGIIFIRPEFIDVPIKICRFLEGKNILSKFDIILSGKFLEIQQGLISYKRNTRVLILTFILTTISWIFFETLSHYILLLGFGIKIPYLSLLGIVAISWILGTISILPGGLGVREAVYAIMLTKYGVALGTGIAVAVVYRGIIYVLFGSLAVVSTMIIDKE